VLSSESVTGKTENTMSSELRICLIRKAVKTQLRALNKVMCVIIRWQCGPTRNCLGGG
jgi:hypothetical protein